MSNRRLSKRSRSQALGAGIGAALVLAAGTIAGAVAGNSAASAATGVTLGPAPLGLDVAPWDGPYSGAATRAKVQSLLQAAGVTQLHYGGGIAADEYDWETNKRIDKCAGPATAPMVKTTAMFGLPCAQVQPLDFSLFSSNARGLGAESFVTVNAGTGTQAMAVDWATRAAATAGQQVAEFEVGNENYGCWTDNEWLAEAPELYTGYQPNVASTCPMVSEGVVNGLTTMATSYAAHAGAYIAAMRAADPDAKYGVPWAFDNTVGGATVDHNYIWNQTVLQAVKPDFVDAHWYPGSWGYGGPNTGTSGEPGVGGNPTAQQVIQSVKTIPSEYAKIQATLNQYDPGASVIVGETGVSYLPTTVTCEPSGALFAAGDVLEWLAAGAKSIDWWPMDTGTNAGSACANPDEGMFTGNGTPDTAYTGYLLAGQLAKPGATLSVLNTNAADVLGFQSVLPGGQPVVALINTSTAKAEKATISSALTGYLATTTYSAGNQNAANSKTAGGFSTVSAIAGGISMPAQSIMIIKENKAKPSGMTLSASAASYKAGAKVTLKGKLTLNGAAAPAGVPVKVYRRAAGSSVNAATLTVKTGAGGAFTVTDVPSSHGTWNYVASYASDTYMTAAKTVTVKVTQVAPSLKLGVSASSVKPGKKVTVTATLGAPHANKTLAIYARAKGGPKKLIKRGTVNSKGQVAVVFTVKANTTFTVTFVGDSWYTPGSKTASVKG